MEEFQELDNFYDTFFCPTHTTGSRYLPVPQDRADGESDENDVETEHERSTEQDIRSLVDKTTSNDDETAHDSNDEEYEDILDDGCRCKKACLSNIPLDNIQAHVFNLREMEKDVKEMYIIGALHKVSADKRSRYGERKRMRYNYTYEGHSLCRKAFCAIYDIPERSLQRLIKHVNENGSVPRVHGNHGKKPQHAMTFEDAERAVQFITNYASEKGLPQPAAPRGRDDRPPVFLKASKTKKHLHSKYEVACQDASHRVLSYPVFTNLWKQCCPHIQIAKPESDVCGKCEMLRKHVADARSEEDKLSTATQLQKHILTAKTERKIYRNCIEASLAQFADVPVPRVPAPPCTKEIENVHYTFDFAQSVSLPHHARQMGPLYFLTARKVHLFAVRDDGLRRQYNYIIDEAETISKDGKGIHGPDGVISMLDHALGAYSHGEKKMTLHSDNCAGQNKNRYVMGYLAWRTMTGLNEEIEYHMMTPGHARCMVDSGFGFVKMLYRRSDCETMSDIEQVVNRSSEVNQAVRYEVDGRRTWEWRAWKELLKPIFKAVKGIRSFQHFRFSASAPGIVFVKAGADDDEVPIQLCAGDVVIPRDRPGTISPAGLSDERALYLARHIRPYMREYSRDVTCPMTEE